MNFARQNLRDGVNFFEHDYRGIDPRTLFRHLKREIQEVPADKGFKYSTETPDETTPHVIPESVGTESGRVEARLTATTGWQYFAGQQTQEEPSLLLPMIVGVIGGLLALVGFTLKGSGRGFGIGLGLLLLIVAGLIYYLSDPNVKGSEYYYRKRTRVLFDGELAETADDGDPASLTATDLSVIYSEDIEIKRQDPETTERVYRANLPNDVRQQLSTDYTLITDEIELPEQPHEDYRHRTL